MYTMPMPIANIRTRIREEFERHRFVSKLSVVDVLLFKSHAEYQVRMI
jgi:NADH dehydrogenase (ubiquinone) 1 alpha subcomplex subunit 6